MWDVIGSVGRIEEFSSEDWLICSGCAKNSIVERTFATEATIMAVSAENRRSQGF